MIRRPIRVKMPHAVPPIALTVATVHALATNLNSSQIGTLANDVNQVVLGADAPFGCTSLPNLWYTADQARHLITDGLDNCHPKSKTLNHFLECRQRLRTNKWMKRNHISTNATHVLACCLAFVQDVPAFFQPRKIAQAGKSVKEALNARLVWLKHDLLPMYLELRTIFEPGSHAGSGSSM